jgi:hypothetical protein
MSVILVFIMYVSSRMDSHGNKFYAYEDIFKVY